MVYKYKGDHKEMTEKITEGSGLRFEAGTKACGLCKTKEDIIQFERSTEKKGLPIIEIAFACRACAKKEGLMDNSTEIEEE